MIEFEDFVPEVLNAGGLFTRAEFEAFGGAVARASDWASQPGITVINVETVVLPNVHNRHEEGSTDSSLPIASDSTARWHQFVRVWYSTE